MASFDIVNKIDLQKIDNAVNTAQKELINRYDLKDELCSIALDKKNNQLRLEAKQDMAINTMVDIVLAKFSKQGVDVRMLDLSKDLEPSGKILYKLIPIKEGINKETAKKIIQAIKDSKLKVQASIMDDQLRITSKSLDELQATIALVRSHDFETPLQFENMRS
jgi:uncharacterized protein YajQ (UPF0234 family)